MTPVESWIEQLDARYRGHLTRPELLKAIRALSWRYVQRRPATSAHRTMDSPGKRAAFAMFYAPLHFLAVGHIARALGPGPVPAAQLLDLGCGTGVSSAAWALSAAHPPAIIGVDAHPWAAAEAAWTWRTLGLHGRARRGDLVTSLEAVRRTRRRQGVPTPAAVLGWSANELDPAARGRLLRALIDHFALGGAALVVEPIARPLTPWWPEWTAAFLAAGGRADEWDFPARLPSVLADLNESAGFSERRLTARSLWRAAP